MTETGGFTLRRGFLFFALCWAMAFSLGFPTLNRYPEFLPQLSDATYYARMIVSEAPFGDDVPLPWSGRILVPFLAKPVALLADGHVGTWRTTSFAMLVVTSAMMAGAALAMGAIAVTVLHNSMAAPLAAFLTLLHFNTSNFMLTGLVDSAEFLLLLAVVLALMKRRWWLLPILGLVGATSRETFPLFAGALAGGWWLATIRTEGLRPRMMVAGVTMVSAGLAVIVVIWSLARAEAGVTTPASIAGAFVRPMDLMIRDLFAVFTAKGTFYTFAWLLPLGLLGIKAVPRDWLAGAGCAALLALVLSAIAGAGENAGRPLFTTAGPVLLIGATAYLLHLFSTRDRSQ